MQRTADDLTVKSFHRIVTTETFDAECLYDLTEAAERFLADCEITSGLLVAQSLHTTAGLLLNERETGFHADFRRVVDRLVPRAAEYQHDDMTVRWENLCPEDQTCPNGHAHLQHALFGSPTVTLAIRDGRLVLGQWQRLQLVEYDRARTRRVFLQAIGTMAPSHALPVSENGAETILSDESLLPPHHIVAQRPLDWSADRVDGAELTPALEDAEVELIVLVDKAGRAIGSAEKWSSHHGDTPLHLAFSCYVFDDCGRFLKTRRARSKKVWPGVWSNTVCGHPAPEEPVVGAINRRLRYELGMTACDIKIALPTHLYRAPPFKGIVEHEFCPVYVARAASWPQPNPEEVEAYAWVEWEQFVDEAEADASDGHSWWCKNQLKELENHPLILAYSRGLAEPVAPVR